MQVSLSKAQLFLACQQAYYYRYVRRLRRRDRVPAPQLGIILHDYLGTYYGSLKDGQDAEGAHLVAKLKTSKKYYPEMRRMTEIARMAGQEELAIELNGLLEKAGRIADRYYQVRGLTDAEQYEVIAVEVPLKTKVANGLVSRGYVDLITLDTGTGRVCLWEHKSTQSVPPLNVRLFDLQTALYAAQLGDLPEYGPVDTVVWNYLRTKEPTQPTTPTGKMSHNSQLDSTWEVYSQELESRGIDPNDPAYDEMRERLFDRESTVFFPRYDQVIVTDGVILRDYIATGRAMRLAEASWKAGRSAPIRRLSRDCTFCEYALLTHAALTGGDEDDIVRFRFTEATGR